MSQMGSYINASGGGGIPIETITGNTGGAVGPDGSNNINVVGDGVITTVTGNPSTNTETISITGGTNGQVIIAATAGSPAWANITSTGGSIVVTNGANTIDLAVAGTELSYTNVTTTPYVVLSTDYYLSVDSSSLAITVNLPNAPATKKVYVVKDRTGNSASNNITVTTPGGTVTIDGGTTFVMNTAYESIQVIFNGTSYEIF